MTLLAFVQTVGATESTILVDPAGDSTLFSGPDGEVPLPPGSPHNIDLATVTASETLELLWLNTTLHRGRESTDVHSALRLELWFERGLQAYHVHAERSATEADVLRMSSEGVERLVGLASLEVRQDTSQWSVGMPRAFLVDGFGSPPGVGDRLTGLQVKVAGTEVRNRGELTEIRDVGTSDEPYVFRLGLEQTGIARLGSSRAAVASNGDAATYAFPFVASNLDTTRQRFRLSWSGAPDAWDVSVAEPVLTLDGGASIERILVVRVPFAHSHGARDELLLTMDALDTVGKGQVVFSVYYHEIPQLAGHHDTLYLHARAQSGTPVVDDVLGEPRVAYMNTLVKDPADDLVAVRAATNSRPIESYEWDIRLDPRLSTGLLFADGGARLIFDLQSEVPQRAFVVEASLRVVAGADRTEVIRFDPSGSVEFDAGQARSFELVGSPQVGVVAPSESTELVLHLNATSLYPTLVTAREAPLLLPGGRLELPLAEYRDPLVTAGDSALNLRLENGNRVVRPGASIVVKGSVESLGSVGAVEVQIAGLHEDWVRRIEPDYLALAEDTSASFQILLTVPADAPTGDIADLVVTATGADYVGAARLLVEVDPSGEGSSEEASRLLGEVDKDSPMSGGVMAFALIAALVAIRRKLET